MAPEPSAGDVVRWCCARGINTAGEAKPFPGSPSSVDWAAVLETAATHRVLPLVKAGLAGTDLAVPEAVRADLDAECRSIARHNLGLTASLDRILETFDRNGIRALAYKGPVLAVRAYGDVGRRQFVDVDLLVARAEFPAAVETLESVGYEPRKRLTGLHQTVFTDDRGVIVDLHAAVVPRYFPGRMAFESLWDGHRRVHPTDDAADARSYSSSSGIPTLAPEDLLLVLCVHGTKHCWMRLSWICDVARLLSTHEFDWRELWARADRLGYRRMVAVGLLLANREFDVSLPSPIAGAIRDDRPAGTLADSARDRLFQSGDVAPSFGRRFRFHTAAMTRHSDRARYALRLGTTPTEGEFGLVDLPDALFPLYYLLRPLRLIAVYGPRVCKRAIGRATRTDR